MKSPINTSRCITIVGPSQSGKTTLMESILHVCGQIHHKGRVEENEYKCNVYAGKGVNKQSTTKNAGQINESK